MENKPTSGIPDRNVPVLAVAQIPDGDKFIFYYEVGSKITYYKGEDDSYSIQTVKYKANGVNTEAVESSSALAVTVYRGTDTREQYELRLYYVDSDNIINELCLVDVSKNDWIQGRLTNKKWKASSKSGLSAAGFHEVGNGNVELYFMDKDQDDRITRACSFCPGDWSKKGIS